MPEIKNGKKTDKKPDKKIDQKTDKPVERNYITRPGYQRLLDELTWLATVERPRICKEVSDAAAEGDRSENAAYIYGKRRLREIDRRMGFISKRFKTVVVVESKDRVKSDQVFFGATVEVEDDDGNTEMWRIVGVDEVDASAGKVSWQSPIGKALLGKREGDTVMVRWHAGTRELTIVGIRYEEAT